MFEVKRKMTVLLAAAGTLAMLAVSSGCRPDETIPDGDTTIVVDTYPDTIGVWLTDTATTSYDMLLIHQQELDDVYFDYNSYDLSQDALDILMEDARYIMDTDGFRVLVEGHCDERGTIDYNLALGEHRALAVYNYLVNYGVPATRLDYVSYGKERPFDPAHTELAWSLNRRAHFRVLPGN